MRIAAPTLRLFEPSRPEGPGDDAGKDAAETGWMELRAQPGGAWAFFVSVFASEELDQGVCQRVGFDAVFHSARRDELSRMGSIAASRCQWTWSSST